MTYQLLEDVGRQSSQTHVEEDDEENANAGFGELYALLNPWSKSMGKEEAFDDRFASGLKWKEAGSEKPARFDDAEVLEQLQTLLFRWSEFLTDIQFGALAEDFALASAGGVLWSHEQQMSELKSAITEYLATCSEAFDYKDVESGSSYFRPSVEPSAHEGQRHANRLPEPYLSIHRSAHRRIRHTLAEFVDMLEARASVELKKLELPTAWREEPSRKTGPHSHSRRFIGFLKRHLRWLCARTDEEGNNGQRNGQRPSKGLEDAHSLWEQSHALQLLSRYGDSTLPDSQASQSNSQESRSDRSALLLRALHRSSIAEDRARARASGLKWNLVSTELPKDGQELSSEALSKALESKSEFTEKEWRQFGIMNLRMDHCVRSGDKYFRPAARAAGTIRGPNNQCTSVTESPDYWPYVASVTEKLLQHDRINDQQQTLALLKQQLSLIKQMKQDLNENMAQRVLLNRIERDVRLKFDKLTNKLPTEDVEASKLARSCDTKRRCMDEKLLQRQPRANALAMNEENNAFSGLLWRNVDARPTSGKQLEHKELAAALKSKIELTKYEWAEFTKEQWEQLASR
eukprot:7382756-Prymnesium_polylepis.1